MLVTGKFTIDALSGPVGIYKATEEVAQFGVFKLMNWAAILSINLGIMNLLPLPALDGGRLCSSYLKRYAENRLTGKKKEWFTL